MHLATYTVCDSKTTLDEIGARQDYVETKHDIINHMDGVVSREDILNVAYASPAAVLLHKRTDWIDLFDQEAILVDPEGTWEARGKCFLEQTHFCTYLLLPDRFSNALSN